jgi:hypothetical protein
MCGAVETTRLEDERPAGRAGGAGLANEIELD